MQSHFEKQIYTKLNNIENEIEDIKILVATRAIPKRKLVSLRGMGKLLVSEEELDKAIEEAKKSLFKGADDVCS